MVVTESQIEFLNLRTNKKLFEKNQKMAENVWSNYQVSNKNSSFKMEFKS